MCVAILQKQGATTLTREELKRGWRVNPDGGGYAYIDRASNKIMVRKFMDKEGFINNYLLEHEKHGDYSPFIVHMRIATHGAVKEETAHPFRIDAEYGDMVFAHNGIISEVAHETDASRSDTMAFRDLFLNELPDSWLDNVAIVTMMEDYIGWSKFVFLTTSDNVEHETYILNEGLGFWGEDEKTWFSNSSTQAVKAYTPSKNYKTRSGPFTHGSEDSDLDDWPWGAEDSRAFPSYSTSPAMSLVVREKMNELLVSDGVDVLLEEANKLKYCEFCLFSPCMCDDTCYYCNSRSEYCRCGGDETFVTIEDMVGWVGEDNFQLVRIEELENELKAIDDRIEEAAAG